VVLPTRGTLDSHENADANADKRNEEKQRKQGVTGHERPNLSNESSQRGARSQNSSHSGRFSKALPPFLWIYGALPQKRYFAKSLYFQ